LFQIETGAPLLNEQVRQAKKQLHDLRLSTAAYLEAKKQPPEKQTSLPNDWNNRRLWIDLHLQLAIVLYERLQKHEEEEVRLKKKTDTSR
jgi:hypothetical protein